MGVCSTEQPPKLVVHKASKRTVEKRTLSRISNQEISLRSSSVDVTASLSFPIRASPDSRRRRVHFGNGTSTSFQPQCRGESSAASDLSITTTVHQIPSNEGMDDHQRSILWWTKEERRDILARNQAMIQDYLRRHPLHVRHMQQVFNEDCCQFPGSTASVRSASVLVSSEDDDTASASSSSSSSDDSDDDECDNGDAALDAFEERCQQRRHRRRRRRLHRQPSLHALCRKRQQQRQQRSQQLETKMNLPICVRGLEYGILPDAKSHRKIHRQRVLDWQARLRTSKRSSRQQDDMAADMPCQDGETRPEDDILEQQSTISSHRSRRLAQLLAASDASKMEESDSESTAQPSSYIHGDTNVQGSLHQRLSMFSSNSGYGVTSSMRQSRPRMMPTNMW